MRIENEILTMSHAILYQTPFLGSIRTQLNTIIWIKPAALQCRALHASDVILIQIAAKLSDLFLHKSDCRAPFHQPVSVSFAALDVAFFVLIVEQSDIFFHCRAIEATRDSVNPILPLSPGIIFVVDLLSAAG